MPKIHLPFNEYFNRHSKSLEWKLDSVEIAGPFGGMESFSIDRLYAMNGKMGIADRPLELKDDPNEDIVINLYSENWDEYLNEIKTISSKYEKATGLTVHIKST